MAAFEIFAAKCAATVALDVLLGIASIESGGRPLSIRADSAPIAIPDPGAGVAMALAASDKGREVGIGLLGLTERQLASAGISITEAFEPCSNLRAGAAQFDRAAQDAMKRGLIGAGVEKSAIRSWWRPDGGYVSSEFLRACGATRTQISSLVGDKGTGRQSTDRRCRPHGHESDGAISAASAASRGRHCRGSLEGGSAVLGCVCACPVRSTVLRSCRMRVSP